MTDGYWNRQQHAFIPTSGMLKRPRTDQGNEMHGYISHDNDHAGLQLIKDTKTIGSAYDSYLQSAHLSTFTSGEASTIAGIGVGLARAIGGGMLGHSLGDPTTMGLLGSGGPDHVLNGQAVNYGGQLPVDAVSRPGPETVPLPPDASSTLYVEGLPSDSTRREVAHIFCPFVGYREVRLVSKESKNRGGDHVILCFVDFANPACAATAMSALQVGLCKL